MDRVAVPIVMIASKPAQIIAIATMPSRLTPQARVCLQQDGAQLCGTGYFWPLRRYFSLEGNRHTTLEMPCSDSKMAMSLHLNLY